MKIRKGFVSNSSSSSFLLKFKSEPTVEDCRQLLIETWGYQFKDYEEWDNTELRDGVKETKYQSQAEKLHELLEPFEFDENAESWKWQPLSKSKYEMLINSGYKLYEVELSDHQCDKDCIHRIDSDSDDWDSEDYLECAWGWCDNNCNALVEYKSNH